MFSKPIAQFLAEFLGTFFFLLTIPLASQGVGTLSPLPMGFMLSALCFTLRYISGAHFNPAISFAIFINQQLSIFRFFAYLLAQILAGFTAAVYLSLIKEPTILLVESESDIQTIWRLSLWELVYVFALTCAVLHASYSGQKRNDFYGISIGMTFLSAAYTIQRDRAVLLNPAGITGASLFAWLKGNPPNFIFILTSWLAPLGGAFAGAIFYQILDIKDDERGKRVTHTTLIY